MRYKETSINDWLLDAKSLTPGDELNIHLNKHRGPPPTFADMRAALYAQFGADTPIRIWKHGEHICIFIHRYDEDRKRFDQRNGLTVFKDGAYRKEIECGFVKELPSRSD